MPYEFSDIGQDRKQIDLWAHSSLPNKGFAGFILSTFVFITLPLYALLGTHLFWGLLPFLMIAVAAMWFALRKNYRDRSIVERLVLSPEEFNLVRQNPNGSHQTWDCNAFWARIHMHERGGPVPYYVTLTGNGREVELGSFLSEEERKELYSELASLFSQFRKPKPIAGL